MDASSWLRRYIERLPRVIAPAPPRDAGATTWIRRLVAEGCATCGGDGLTPGLSSVVTIPGCGCTAASGGDPSGGDISGGSLLFGQSGTAALDVLSSFPNLGTGDFTVEWYQYLPSSATGTHPRVFTVGNFPEAVLAVSEEGASTARTLYVWVNADAPLSQALDGPFYNTWAHIAVERSSGTLALFFNGSPAGSVDDSSDTVDGTGFALTVGNQTGVDDADSVWPGELTNFRIVAGAAVYPMAGFTPPSSALTAISGTLVLLLAATSTNAFLNTGAPSTATTPDGGVAVSADTPFPFLPPI